LGGGIVYRTARMQNAMHAWNRETPIASVPSTPIGAIMMDPASTVSKWQRFVSLVSVTYNVMVCAKYLQMGRNNK